MIEFHRVTLENCDQARGVVVVIDVLRAFTTAAFAFDAGAEEIILVSTLEQARELKRRDSQLMLTGENHGWKPADFDFGNSPLEFLDQDLHGARLVQRTSAGTQGVVRSSSAENLFAASLCCARGTVDAIRTLKPAHVTFVLTGVMEGGLGDEDTACADYLEALLRSEPINLDVIEERVRNSGWGLRFNDQQYPFLNRRDLDFCLQMDRFPFAMPVEKSGDRQVMRAVFHASASDNVKKTIQF